MVPGFAKGLYLLLKGAGYESIMWAEAEPARAARRVADVVERILSGSDEIYVLGSRGFLYRKLELFLTVVKSLE